MDSLQLLEFIEDGNGVGKNYSLTDEMFMEAITTVAKRFTLGCDVCFPCHLSREADVDAVMHNCNLLHNMMKEVDGNEL